MSKALVLYHANCTDGFCAAWAAHRYFGDNAEYLPVSYGQEPPDVAGRNLYILDFSYKRPVMERLIDAAAEIVVLDHHKTAQAEFVGLEEYARQHITAYNFVFDMGKSGGRLAWEQFFPGEKSPWMVDYTEDRDLWRWKLPNSKEISAAIASYPFDFVLWDNWYSSSVVGSDVFNRLVAEGKAILRYRDQLVARHVENATETEVAGHRVLAVNATCLMSEIGEALAQGKPFGATFFERKDGKRVWSLRSRDGGIDVSAVAKANGGGGHAQAAGFEEVRA